MRLHLRRHFFLLIIFTLSCFAIFLYFNPIVQRKRKNIHPNIDKRIFLKKGKHVFWTRYSGVIKIQSNLDIFNSFKRNQVIRGNEPEEGDDVYNEDDKGQLQTIPFNLNIYASDFLPLNREVPDSRPKGCKELVSTYPYQLPTVSIVIPFHNEWPSVLLRTVHSIIDRTPKHLLKKIILVDDASDLNSLKSRLNNYVNWTFPGDLVKIVRLPLRQGLIKARLEGFKEVSSETVSFFDSHMEVNHDWLQPLLFEIKKNRKTIAMTQLDYIDSKNFDYNFYEHYRTRYGFKWDMEFFETFFRPDQLEGKLETDPLPGVLMVGPGFVADTQYFKELGMYDGEMKIWGGENIEFAWRTWMCGGRMLQVPCSHVGHVERSQPYTFPEGRRNTEMFNYKRAVEVWLGPYKEYVYDAIPGIRDIDVGNVTERLNIKSRLKCKDFKWFLDNIWPELLPYEDVGELWGQISTDHSGNCLDNNGYLFRDPVPLLLKPCSSSIQRQTFALTPNGQLRTSLHCVVALPEGQDLLPFLQNCLVKDDSAWVYGKTKQLVYQNSGLCLQVMAAGRLALQPCRSDLGSQKWIFRRDIWNTRGN